AVRVGLRRLLDKLRHAFCKRLLSPFDNPVQSNRPYIPIGPRAQDSEPPPWRERVDAQMAEAVCKSVHLRAGLYPVARNCAFCVDDKPRMPRKAKRHARRAAKQKDLIQIGLYQLFKFFLYHPSSCKRRRARPTATLNSGPASLRIASRN